MNIVFVKLLNRVCCYKSQSLESVCRKNDMRSLLFYKNKKPYQLLDMVFKIVVDFYKTVIALTP